MIVATLVLANAQFSQQDIKLLDELQHKAVNFFWEQSNPATGFTKDRARNNSTPGDPTVASAAAVGFALVAYPIGVERKWLTRKQALERTKITLKHLNTTWPSKNGFLYHFIDYKNATREWNCEISSIDTSICLAGVLAAEQYWKDAEVSREAQKFAKRIDWKWMLTDDGAKKDETHFSMGWKPEDGFIPHRWATYDENKMLYIQAYGLSDIRTDGWAKMNRPLEKYKGIDFIRGGPLFIHHMSESFYDFKGMRDELGFNYSIASKNASLANRAYCIDNPKKMKGYGPNFWGLSASDVPSGYTANGAPGWTQDDGTITPTSSVAAIQWLPKEAMQFAHAMRKEHPKAWGRYGFPNGYNPTANWESPDVIGIDLGMMLLAIENVRTGLPIKLSASHPAIKRGYQRAGLKKVKGGDSGPMLLKKK